MFLWNERKLLIVVSGIEELIDEVFVTKAEMLAVGEQLGSATIIMLQFAEAGRPISCAPQVHCEPRFQPIFASTYYARHFTSFFSNRMGVWVVPFQ